MLWAEIREEIKDSLDEPATEGHWTDAAYLRKANIIMREICKETRCLESAAKTNSVAGQAEYLSKQDIIRIVSLYYDNGNGFIELTPTSRDELNDLAALGKIKSPWVETTGTPKAWWKRGNFFGLYPKPDVSGTNNILIYYEEIVDELTSDDSVPFNGKTHLYDSHQLVVLGTVALMLGEDERGKYTAMYERGKKELKRQVSDESDLLTFDLIRASKRDISGFHWTR